MQEDIGLFCVSSDASLEAAIACIDRNLRGIALVVDADGSLLGTITDGDVRRAMLQGGADLAAPARSLLPAKGGPITAPVGTSRKALLEIMRQRRIRQVPLVDEQGRARGLAAIEDLLPVEDLPLQAVVMAGGKGTRLHPLTEDLPKPMLPVGERPVLELLLGQLKQCGVRRINITTHYKAERITSHFGDGRDFGVELSYVNEESPLGTAGALGLLDAPGEPLLVINGDIVTRVDFRALHAYHQEHGATITVGVRQYDFEVPYGVVESDGPRVVRISEKPVQVFFVNAGIYLLEPRACALIPPGVPFDMPDLIARALEAGETVVSFPIREYWLDIGEHAAYRRAQEDASALQGNGAPGDARAEATRGAGGRRP